MESSGEAGGSGGISDDLAELYRLFAELQIAHASTLSRRSIRMANLLARLIRRPSAIFRRKPRRNQPGDSVGPLDDGAYQSWIRTNEGHVRKSQSSGVRFSLVMPVCDPPVGVLVEAVRSIQAQSYPFWEAILVDDASRSEAVIDFLRNLAGSDSRICVLTNSDRLGIVGSSNRGIAVAHGDWVAFVDHDDVLARDVLLMCAKHIDERPSGRMLYTDEDKLVDDGHRIHPRFKSGFDPLRLLHENYVNHLAMYRCDLLNELGGLRTGTDGSQDWDLALRASRIVAREEVLHVYYVGYHWRQTDGQFSRAGALIAQKAGLESVRRHLDAVDASLRPVAHPRQRGAIALKPPTDLQNAAGTGIALIVPVRNSTPSGLRRTVENLAKWHSEGVVQIHAVCSTQESGGELGRRAREAELEVEIIVDDYASLGAMVAAAASEADAEVAIISDESLSPSGNEVANTLAGYLALPGVGLAGPRILNLWGRLEAGPLRLSDDGLAVGDVGAHAWADGYFGHLSVAQEVPALVGHCIAAPTEFLEECVGSYRETSDATSLGLSLTIASLRSGEAAAWIPTVSVWRRSREGDPSSVPASYVNQVQMAEILHLAAAGQIRCGLHPALRVVDGHLLLRDLGT